MVSDGTNGTMIYLLKILSCTLANELAIWGLILKRFCCKGQEGMMMRKVAGGNLVAGEYAINNPEYSVVILSQPLVAAVSSKNKC